MTSEVGEFELGNAAHPPQHHEDGRDCRSCDLATVNSASAGLVCGILGLLGVQCPPIGTGNGTAGYGNCFLKGTKIRTAERRAQDRRPRDRRFAADDVRRTAPIQWIGRYPVKKSDPSKPWAKSALPVRIARSALAPNVPHADLYVTAAP